jgi:hypothetical protein
MCDWLYRSICKASFCLYLFGLLHAHFYSSAAPLGGVAGRFEAPLLHYCFGASGGGCIMEAGERESGIVYRIQHFTVPARIS